MKWLYYAAAGTTAAAGILHLAVAPGMFGFNANSGVFLLAAGIAQLFWAVPMVRRWGAPWYAAGIGGTAVLVAMYAVTRLPDNPVTGMAGRTSEMGVAIEALQAAFIGLASAVLAMKRGRVIEV
jgi:hypothetical protein